MNTFHASPSLHRIDKRADIERLTKTRLRYVSVHLTDYCNARCQFCVVNTPICQVPIPTTELVDYVRGFAGKGFDILNIHGGEPTLSKALLPVIDAARDIGIDEVHLQTNGIRLYDRTFVAKLIQRGVKVFVISLHGHTAELQEEISLAKGSFPKILQGIENCVGQGALVRINTVVCCLNLAHLLDIFRLIHALGVPWLNLSALHPTEHTQAQFAALVPSPEEIRTMLPSVLTELQRSMPELHFELEGFATCHVPGFESYHLNKTNREIHVKYHQFYFADYERYMDTMERAKAADCRACRFVGTCNGVYRVYLDRFAPPHYWVSPETAGIPATRTGSAHADEEQERAV